MRYQRAFVVLAVAAQASGGSWNEAGRLVLEEVIDVSDALQGDTSRLIRLAGGDTPVFCDLDPQPVQPFALDYTWAAIVGLVANIEALAEVLDDFPADRWHRGGVWHGRPLSALGLANGAVHAAVHHLFDIEHVAPELLDTTERATRDPSPVWENGEDDADVAWPTGPGEQSRADAE